MDRRTFIEASAIAGAMAGVAALSGCSSPRTAGEAGQEKEQGTTQLAPADYTVQADVVVVGAAGVSGYIASLHAVDCGLDVHAIARASGFGQTNNVQYGGVFALETPSKKAQPAWVSKEDFFNKFISTCNNQANFDVVRNMIVNSAETNALVEEAADGFYSFAGEEPVTELVPDLKYYGMYTCDCWPDDLYGDARAAVLDDQAASHGLKINFECQATSLLFDGEKVYGVRYTDSEGKSVDALAKNVIIACGGCAHNPELLARLSKGGRAVGIGSPLVDGSGIQMAFDAGAAEGKCFALDMVEFGAGNVNASPQISYLESEGPLTLMMGAGLFVNKEGRRFMPEQVIIGGIMFCSGTFTRNPSYYCVVDQATVDKWSVTPIYEALGAAAEGLNPGMDMLWGDVVVEDMQEQMDAGVQAGWIFKGDTPEDLAAAMGSDALAETIVAYNGYCAAGHDDQFYKDASLLVEMPQGPYYAVECMPAVFNTMGGVKVDGFCRALREDSTVIDGLFVVGSDADLWSNQYHYGNTAQGFESMSGYLAADICAGNEMNYQN